MAKRQIIPEDLYRFKFISTPQITISGDRVAYVVTEVGEDRNTYNSRIFQLDLVERVPQFITGGTMPRWSPDGERLAYLTDGEIWVVKTGREKERVFKGEITQFVWSPEGDKLAVVAEVKSPTSLQQYSSGLHHINRLKYKANGKGYIYNQRPQLFIVDINRKETRQLTVLENGVNSPVFAPDGESVAFVTSDEDPDGTWQRQIIRLDLFDESRKIICRGTGIQDLSWSPDGRYIAYRAAQGEYDPSVNFELWIVQLEEGKPLNLTAGFDRFVGNDRTLTDTIWGSTGQGGIWTEDSSKLFFIATDRGKNTICEVTLNDKVVKRHTLTGDLKVVYNFSYSPEKNIIIAAGGSFENPGDLWLIPGGERLTKLNDELLSEIEVITPERLKWSGLDGTPVEGWVLKPVNYEVGRTYPAILEIHGGPYRQYGMTYFHELQLLAASGYVVFFPNPRGSQGYGQEFARQIKGDWGNKDYTDIMAGLDYLISLGYVDVNRLGVTGGSYGGYMTNWIITQTNRFKAAVTDRSVSNLHSFMGTSDIAISFGESDYGNIWNKEQLKRMLESSPISYVDQVKTPILIMHQMEDYNCPLEQAEQFYVALKRLGATCEMVLFPEANHELSRRGNPLQRLQRLHWILNWFEKYL